LANLLSDITDAAKGFKVDVYIFDDGSKVPATVPLSKEGGPQFKLFRRQENGGKKRYWDMVNLSFSHVKKSDADYFIMIPDDVRLPKDFFENTTDLWDNLTDPKKICINLILDKARAGRSNWTGFTPQIRVEDSGHRYFKTQWNDVSFIAGRKFFEVLDYRISPISRNRWDINPRLGSGVGRDLSLRLKGYNLYQVRKPVLDRPDIPSVMNPNRPARERAIKIEYTVDTIHCGLATIPIREPILKATIDSILPYVDFFHGSICQV